MAVFVKAGLQSSNPIIYLDGFYKNQSFKIAMSGLAGGQAMGGRVSGIIQGLLFG